MPLPLLWKKIVSFGRRSEILGVDYLKSMGYRVVASSYQTKNGEVDIVAWDDRVLAFVEVKARQNDDPPEDAVGRRKQERVIRAAKHYMSRYRLNEKPYRFDILAVTVLPGSKPSFRLMRDAFRVRAFMDS